MVQRVELGTYPSKVTSPYTLSYFGKNDFIARLTITTNCWRNAHLWRTKPQHNATATQPQHNRNRYTTQPQHNRTQNTTEHNRTQQNTTEQHNNTTTQQHNNKKGTRRGSRFELGTSGSPPLFVWFSGQRRGPEFESRSAPFFFCWRAFFLQLCSGTSRYRIKISSCSCSSQCLT